jgi:phage shock protein PspC (stress-responsive transcriptional regulator)
LLPDVPGGTGEQGEGMTETPSPSPTAPLPPPPPPPASVPLLRSTERAVVAGVCAGVARRWGVDPTLVRVLTVVLALFAGVGVVLYALGWLLLPDDTGRRSVGERAVRGGGPDATSTVLLALGLVLVVLVVGAGLLRDSWFPLVVLAVVVLLAAAVLSRRPGPGGPPAGTEPTPYPYATTTYADPASSGPAHASGPAHPGAPGPAAPADTLVSPEASGYVATSDPAYPSGYRPSYGWDAGYATPGAVPAAPPRPRSVLGLLTLSVAAVAVGVLALVDLAGASVAASAYLALPLAVVGLGLVVGGWRGRARGLVAAGVVLALLLAAVSVVEAAAASDRWDEAFADRVVAPTSAAGLDGRVVEQGVGDLTYDLSGVSLPAGETDLTLRVGAGSLTVVVPDDATVELDAEVGLGELSAFGSATEGAGISRSQRDPGAAGAGTLLLDVQVGLGTVEVDRAGA